MPPVIEIPRGHNPFPASPTVGVSRDADGIPRYDELARHPAGHARRAGRPSPGQRGSGRVGRRPIDLPAAVGPRVAGRRRAARGRSKTGRPRRRALPGGNQLGAGVLGHRDGRRRCGGGQYALRATGGRVRAVRLRCAGWTWLRTHRCPTGSRTSPSNSAVRTRPRCSTHRAPPATPRACRPPTRRS